MEPIKPRVTRRDFLGASVLTASAAAACKAPVAATTSEPTPTSAGAHGGPAPTFPAGFAWGVATSSYQIEGAAREDGRGVSVWDVFCQKKGAVWQGHSGDVACDHYHRYAEDVALMKRLGISSYRFSVAWPRILPGGVGKPNERGLDFYERLVDELLRNRIEPLCTVFHWDYPQPLQDRGGWLNRDSADWFAEYTSVLGRRLGDRVKSWVTQNEPECFIGLALYDGSHAPGLKLSFSEFLLAAHNALRAHGKSVAALRATVPQARVGYVVAADVYEPATDAREDVEAARTAMFAVTGRTDWSNAWWVDPVLTGKYPDDGLALYAKEMPAVAPRDLEEIHQPIDFLGLNVYATERTRRGADGRPEKVPFPPGYPRSGVDWQPITPACLYWGPRFFHERYRVPLVITENGLSTRDQVFLDGAVHDPQRIDYLHRVLRELSRAVAEGVPVTGYYAWSLLDNFEWADGYKQRFGLVYVDFVTQRRIPKDSFEWYRQVIASSGGTLREGGAAPLAVLSR